MAMIWNVIVAALVLIFTAVPSINGDVNTVRGRLILADEKQEDAFITTTQRDLQVSQPPTWLGVDSSLAVILFPDMGGDNTFANPSGQILSIVPAASTPNPLIIDKGTTAVIRFTVTVMFGEDRGLGPFAFLLRDGVSGTTLISRGFGFPANSAPRPNFGPIADDFVFRIICDEFCDVSVQWLDFNGILNNPQVPTSVPGKSNAPAQLALKFMGFPSLGTTAVETACVGEAIDNSPDGNTGAVSGDPHFKTWKGHRFDYHGMCDMVMIHAPNFQHGVGFDFHIRTKLHNQFSYIESAVLRFGKDILEIGGNGLVHYNRQRVHRNDFPLAVAVGRLLRVEHERPDAKHHAYSMDLSKIPGQATVNCRILVKSYGKFVSVMVDVSDENDESFAGALGLMGEFGTGRMLGRDGTTLMEDPIMFGEEWQVLASEDMLFLEERGPQHPEKCIMPLLTAEERRRLSGIDRATAEKACAYWPQEDKEACIFDVMATGDLEMASAGAW